jgi:hypothetical protein
LVGKGGSINASNESGNTKEVIGECLG